jgi:hypothetical protein
MRERIIRELRRAAAQSTFDRARWTAIRDRLADIQISTIDAFCLSLLREFPLEADLDPGFGMADETEVPRLVDRSLDTSLAIFIGLAKREPDVALVLAQLGLNRTREGARAPAAAAAGGVGRARPLPGERPADLTRTRLPPRGRRSSICSRGVDGGLERFLARAGPQPRYQLLAQDLRRLDRSGRRTTPRSRPDEPRRRALPEGGRQAADERSHPSVHERRLSGAEAGSATGRRRCARRAVERILRAFSRDLNVVLARGVRRCSRSRSRSTRRR